MTLLKDPMVVNALAEVVGANSLDVVGELAEEESIDEFSLAERLGMDVKVVRKILYKLYDSSLVKFKRFKDQETGWYIYMWSFENHKLKHLVEKVRRNKIVAVRTQLDKETEHQFFMCESGCTRVPFELAMSVGFICPHCSYKMDFKDNSHIIKQLEGQLKEIERTFGQ
ncbi:MAG: transcription factor [Candidatus Altiarchaeota archaeon]|nr:transcription factor [Candidatus Altiarchaeota archaeon]